MGECTKPAYAAGRLVGDFSPKFGCSTASIHDGVKKNGVLRDLLNAGRSVEQVHRQGQRVHAATAASQEERDEPLRVRNENRQLKLERDIL